MLMIMLLNHSQTYLSLTMDVRCRQKCSVYLNTCQFSSIR